MAIPGLKSVRDIGKNILGAVDVGIDAARGTSINWGAAANIGSVGGALSVGGFAGAGALAGGVLGASSGTEFGAGMGALAGGAIGAAALPAAGMAGGLATEGARRFATGGAIGAVDAVSSGAAGLGGAVVGAASVSNMALNPIARYTGMARNLGGKFMDYTPRRWDYNAKADKLTRAGGPKLTGLGKGIIGAGAAVQGVRGAYDALEQSRMGEMDPYVARATPRLPSYANNAGASGDLVFALNANRQG